MRVGVIGTNWGRMHIGAFRRAGAEVVALCGRDAAKTAQIAAEEGIVLATTDVAQLCAASQVVVVASPDNEHPAHVLAALKAGCDVLCEKPLARTADQATQLALEAAARPSQVCAVGFPYRQLPPFVALHQWATQSPRPSQLTVSVRNAFAAAPGREASGDFGGVSHLLDAALWLMGDRPAWVHASFQGLPPHSVSMVIGLAAGGQVTLSQTACVEPGIHGAWSLTADGREAAVAGGYLPKLGGWRVGPAQAFTAEGVVTLAGEVAPIEGALEPWAQAHVETARELLQAISRGGQGRLASFEDGAIVQRVLGAAATSAIVGKRVAIDALQSAK
jgi:myo-inositol 2-dehydrogenase/D-chiro-inositol 1-dehydrogenase